MVLGRSTSLRRDDSLKVHPDKYAPRLLRSLSVNIKGNGRSNSGSSQAIKRATVHSGRDVLVGHIRFYGKYLVPEIAVSVLMFACFACMSLLIPRLICNADAKDPMGKQFGFQNCILKGWHSDNTVTRKGSAIFWLLFYAIQYSWLVAFPAIIGKALCGDSFQRKHLVICIISGMATIVAVLIAVPVAHWGFANMYLTLISSWASGTAVFVVADVVRVHNGGNRIMAYRWILLMLASAGVTTIYLQLMPSLITARSSDSLNGMGLTLVRLVVHPIIWNAIMMMFRQFMLHSGSVPDLMQVCFMLYPALYSSIFGRFLLLQLDSVGSVFLINLMQCALQLAARLSDRGADDVWMALMYGTRGSEALKARTLEDEMRMVELFTTSLAENGGIVAASALMSLGRLITGFIFDFIGLAVEAKYHCYDWARAYPKSVRRVMKYVFVIIVVGSTRLAVELLLLFCPTYDSDTGIVLVSCDRPSIFQAVNVAFAVRNRNTALGSYLNLNATADL